MANHALPRDRYTAETHIDALENLVERFAEDDEPIHYKKAAIGLNENTASSCLKYFGEINLIDTEKAGVYTPNKPVIDFFRKVGKSRKSAIQAIRSILEEEAVFEEALFISKSNKVEPDELAESIAGQLDIDKSEISRVSKAIDVFIALEQFSVSESGIIRPTDLESLNTTTEGDDSDQSDEEVNLSRGIPQEILENFSLPASRAGPDKLFDISDILSQGGRWSLSEIAEESNHSDRNIRDTLRYGEELGFIEQTDENVWKLEPRGFDLGFEENLNSATEELFEAGIKSSREYSALLFHVYREYADDIIEKEQIERPWISREARTFFELIDLNEDTLNRSISSFLQTLEAAGYGDFVAGRGSNPTRLEVESVKGLEKLVEELPVGESNSDDQNNSEETKDSEEDIESEEASSDASTSSEGPPLRISSFRIQNFKNIQDSGKVPLHNITTLIGKNESGKTSTLEALSSFNDEQEYTHLELSRNIEIEDKSKAEIIHLNFELTEEVAEEYYPELDDELNIEFPVSIGVSKYADGHKEHSSFGQKLQDLGYETPTPQFMFYDEYDIIDDKFYADDMGEDSESTTFSNLLEIGELGQDDLVDTIGLQRDEAISQAEEKVERRINNVWSQKDIEIELSYDERVGLINLYIQDQIENGDEKFERGLTLPSQRSEGFRWFFSFFINIIAEATDDIGQKVLLLDDPGVHLHPEGKKDWLETVEDIAADEQVIYSSHSPYLLQKNRPSRIRTVEDRGISGTEIHTDIFDADTGTLEPLRNALGIDYASSPFISQRQILVEGPSEYYLLTAIANYFEEELNREIVDWGDIAIMPVRGANDTIGKASWLASENIEFAILLDSDEKGRNVQENIEKHHRDIDDGRVILLEKDDHLEDIVIEDMVSPEIYVEEFNKEYLDFTSELDEEFEPVTAEESDDGDWNIGSYTYDGARLDSILESVLADQDVSDELENTEGKIELRKRQIAERVAERLNESTVEEAKIERFNRLFARLKKATSLNST